MAPKVFISYSHDNEEHKNWVLQLATRLRSNGVDIVLDRWNLSLGQDLPAFMESGLSESQRVICVCSEEYVKKSNKKTGGVGYEKQIITAELLSDLNSKWVIPVIRNNSSDKKVPTFLNGRLYINFEDSSLYEAHYESLLRDLLNEPVLPIPELGENPFQTAQKYSEQRFFPTSEKYVSPSTNGKVTFDYSNNNGRYSIGQESLLFEISFSKANNSSIYVYNDAPSLDTVAIAKGINSFEEIEDARIYDGSSRVRTVHVNQVAVLKNRNGFFAAIKILSIKDDTRGHISDEITFEYCIQSNGMPSFVPRKPSS